MKKWRPLFHPVVVFILAQLAWLSLLGLWIYWYVSNYIIFSEVGDRDPRKSLVAHVERASRNGFARLEPARPTLAVDPIE